MQANNIQTISHNNVKTIRSTLGGHVSSDKRKSARDDKKWRETNKTEEKREEEKEKYDKEVEEIMTNIKENNKSHHCDQHIGKGIGNNTHDNNNIKVDIDEVDGGTKSNEEQPLWKLKRTENSWDCRRRDGVDNRKWDGAGRSKQ